MVIKDARTRRKRRLIVVLAVLALLVILGFGLYREVTSPRSQPCLDLPEGAAPEPFAVEGQPSGRSGPLTLALAGDAMLGRGVDLRLDRRRSGRLWRGLTRALRDVDVFGFNLECAITDAPAWGSWKMFRFRLTSRYTQQVLTSIPMASGTTRFASVANNHILDFGPEGLVDTLGALREAGIAHGGAGENALAAWQPTVITTGTGVRVGFLALADHCGCLQMGQWVAGRTQPGIAWVNLSGGPRESLLTRVAALDSAVDVLVLSIHSGPNYLPDGPPSWMRGLAEALVEAGADVVWSHSPHHVLPLEQIRGRHVIYGTGGLIDDYTQRPEFRNDLGMVVRLAFSPEGEQTAEVVPIRIRPRGPEVLANSDPDYDEVLRRAGRGVALETVE